MDYIQTGFISNDTKFSLTKTDGELSSLTLNQKSHKLDKYYSIAISLGKEETKNLLNFIKIFKEIKHNGSNY